MKKITLMLVLLLTVFTGCSNKLKTYQEINLNEYKKMIENKETFILYIGAKNCQYCISYTKKLNKIIKEYQVKVYYIDVSLLSETELTEFKGYVYYEGTPTTVFIKNGEEESTYNRIIGNRSREKIIDKLKINGYIK